MKKEECTVIHLIWNDSSNLIFWFEDVALVAVEWGTSSCRSIAWLLVPG